MVTTPIMLDSRMNGLNLTMISTCLSEIDVSRIANDSRFHPG